MTPPDDIELTDAGRRLSEIVTLAIMGGHARRWIAARLSDGGTDGVIYDSHADALRHQLHWRQCAFVSIPLDHMGVAEASDFLRICRELYDRGVRIADPDNPEKHLILPTMR